MKLNNEVMKLYVIDQVKISVEKKYMQFDLFTLAQLQSWILLLIPLNSNFGILANLYNMHWLQVPILVLGKQWRILQSFWNKKLKKEQR